MKREPPLGRGAAVLALAMALAPGAPSAETFAPPLGGDRGIAAFPESADIRARYWSSFFAAPIPVLRVREPSQARNESGSFRLSVESQGDYVYAIAAALKPGGESSRDPPLYTQGTWIIKRSARDGAMIQAKVFLRSDPGAFVRIYPDGDRSKLDLVLFGGVVNREAPMAMPFERVCAASIADIAEWTADIVAWDLLAPHPGLYRDVRSLVEAVRARLPGLAYGEDGALDARGAPVYIATGEAQRKPYGLNCSGFAKWLIDGLYRPLAGASLDPRAMAERHSDQRTSSLAAPFEEELDPYFGLDWTRNLAAALAAALRPGKAAALSANDVRISPFALVAPAAAGSGLAAAKRVPGQAAINGSAEYGHYPPYQEDLGYQTDGLKALLYVLAMRDPGAIYLASVSRRGGGALPGLSRHYHVAVLAPYFEEDGRFAVAVFESAAETGVEAIAARAPDDFVHLVRIPVGRDFDPPPFPSE